MRQYLFLLIVLLLNSELTFAQPQKDFERGEAFRVKQEADSAVFYYNKAADEFLSASQFENYLKACNQAAVALIRKDRFDEARSFLKKSMDIGTTKLDTDNIEIATTYLNYGVIFNAEEDYEKSLFYHYKSLGIRLKKLGENDPQVATNYGNIGNVMYNYGKYDDALTAHLKAGSIREKAYGVKSAEVIESYNNIGKVYKKMKNYSSALEYYQKALNNKIIQRGENHKELEKFYRNLSDVYYLMNDKENGDLNKTKADEIVKT